jgi:hypothetical protein
MKVYLEVTRGPNAPRSFVIEPGMAVEVGREAPAQIVLPDDHSVSRRHFALKFDGENCRIWDLGSTRGTTVNGRPVGAADVFDSDLIGAGSTVFRVVIAESFITEAQRDAPPAIAPTEPASPAAALLETPNCGGAANLHDRVLEVLRTQQDPVFGILDSARDPLILAWLLDCKEEYQSLYEGSEADKMMAVAPYLVALPPDSRFLPQLVRAGWGQSWGVYLTCDRPSHEVRKHLRRFLTVETEDGKKLLFRFYDPRVLSVFLPSCTAEECRAFFGPITGYFVESEGGRALVRFTDHQMGPRQDMIALTKASSTPVISRR